MLNPMDGFLRGISCFFELKNPLESQCRFLVLVEMDFHLVVEEGREDCEILCRTIIYLNRRKNYPK